MKKERVKNILLKILKLLSYVVISFVCLLVVFLIYYIITSQIHAKDEDYKPPVSVYTIVSPSMTPVIKVYDVVVNVSVKSPEDIQVGDIITYVSKAPTSEGMTITHRVIEVNYRADGTHEYLTQGDNNSEPDSLYVSYDQIIGKEIFIIPKLGKLQFLIANKKGWLFLLLIPITIYVIIEIYKLIDLLGLRKRVNKVIGTTEESIIEKHKEEQRIRKETIKQNLQVKKQIEESIKRNPLEPNGFLENYTETVVSVSNNKYKIKPNKKDNVQINNQQIPKKVQIASGKPGIIKEQDDKPIINQPIEILDTDELTTKIKEYDQKIEQLDKMLADINSIPVAKETKPNDDFIEKNDYLINKKIKVKSSVPTKNQKKNITGNKKAENKKTDNVPKIELKEIVETDNKRVKIERPKGEDIKTLRQKELNKVNKKTKLNLNPKNIKNVNRKRINKNKVQEPKKEPTKPFIEIRKVR